MYLVIRTILILSDEKFFLKTRVRDKDTLKKLNRQLEKVADSFGNIIDI